MYVRPWRYKYKYKYRYKYNVINVRPQAGLGSPPPPTPQTGFPVQEGETQHTERNKYIQVGGVGAVDSAPHRPEF